MMFYALYALSCPIKTDLHLKILCLMHFMHCLVLYGQIYIRKYDVLCTLCQLGRSDARVAFLYFSRQLRRNMFFLRSRRKV